MHAKPSFAHRLQTAEMSSYRTSAQNNCPWVQSVLLKRKMLHTRCQWLYRCSTAPPSDTSGYYVNVVLSAVE